MKKYRVTYYAEAPGLPVKRVTVQAPSPDAARDAARALDERYIATAKSPRIVR